MKGVLKDGKIREKIENLFTSYFLEVEIKSGLMRTKINQVSYICTESIRWLESDE